MYRDNSDLTLPSNPSALVWRYMEYWKFRNLIETGTLYFSRADSFADTFEGVLPTGSVEDRPHLANWMHDAKKQTYISCWNENEHEDPNMWNGTLGAKDVAVQTTVQRLRDCFEPCHDAIYISQIAYIDFDLERIRSWAKDPNIFLPIMHKRKKFETENEIRVLLNTMSDTSLNARSNGLQGILIPVDVDRLIETVVVRPGSDEHFRQDVEQLLSAQGTFAPVQFSAI